MKLSKEIYIVIIILLLQIFVIQAFSNEEDHGSWWVNNFGALTVNDHPLIPNAQNVFDRVLAAADKRYNTTPNLVILRELSSPWALCLKDGTIILTQKALEFCYQDVDKQTGDSYIAFIIGHELSHLANDNFWHVEAFKALKKYGNELKSKDIINILKETEDIEDSNHARNIIKKKELKADANGLIYLSMAGFDASAIINTKPKNFLKEWTLNTQSNTYLNDRTHMSNEQRIEFLRTNLKSVRENIVFFDIGVRLYQLGRYLDAIDFINAFKEKYPGREVYNTLGLIHYKLAINFLAKCDKERAFQFKLSTLLDTKTLAKPINKRSKNTSDCYEMTIFKEHIQYAIHYFKSACEKDPYYLPSRINHSSALIIAKDYSGAMSSIDKALNIHPKNKNCLNNRAVAMYLLGLQIKVDMFKQSYDILINLTKEYKNYSDAYYNLARILTERNRFAASHDKWNNFLGLEHFGIYANIARKSLGMKEIVVKKKDASKTNLFGKSPVNLGLLNKKTKKQLASLKKISFELGNVSGAFYLGNQIKVLVLENTIELVDNVIKNEISLQKAKEYFGSPLKVINTYSDTNEKSLIYNNMVFDIKNDLIERVVYFVNDNYNESAF